MTTVQVDIKQTPGRLANRLGLLSGLALLLAILAQSSVVVVNYDEIGLRARLGTLSGILEPGAHLKIPFGIDYIEKVAAGKIIVQEFGYRSEGASSAGSTNAERDMITGDLNIVEIAMTVQYQVRDPIAYLSSVRDADQFVRSATEAIVREIVGRSQSGALYTTSGQLIAEPARTQLQSYLDASGVGVDIKTLEIREISPPNAVGPAFEDVNEARQQRNGASARPSVARRVRSPRRQARQPGSSRTGRRRPCADVPMPAAE